MVECFVCKQQVEGEYNSGDFLKHLEAEHVKLEIGVSKNNEV